MDGIGFKVYQLVSLALIGGSFAYGAYDNFNNLNNLGDQITRQVNEQLAPLQDLGARISANVHQQLEPLRTRLQGNVYNDARQFSGFQQIFSPIQPVPGSNSLPPIQPVPGSNSLSPIVIPPIQPFVQPGSQPIQPLFPPLNVNLDLGLDNLGEQIQQSVYQGLEPVRALEITSKMKNGVGGVTIARFLPEGKTFIINNYQVSECDGSISQSDGKCSGTLTPFKIDDKTDYCYHTQSYSIINNQICIGASSISVINNEIKCLGPQGSPAPLLISVEEFKNLCKGISDSVEYRYIADPQNPAHVKIPSPNKYVKCSNNQPGVCVFTEANPAQNYNGNNVIINSYNSGSHVFV